MGRFRVTPVAAVEWKRRFDIRFGSSQHAAEELLGDMGHPSLSSIKRMRRIVLGADLKLDVETIGQLFRLVDIIEIQELVHYYDGSREESCQQDIEVLPAERIAVGQDIQSDEIVTRHNLSAVQIIALFFVSIHPSGVSCLEFRHFSESSQGIRQHFAENILALESKGLIESDPGTGRKYVVDGLDLGALSVRYSDLQRRAVDYQTEFFELNVPKMSGDPLDMIWKEDTKFESEIENVSIAFDYAIKTKNEEASVLFAMALAKWHLRKSNFIEGQRYLQTLRTTFPLSCAVHSATTYILAGWLSLRLGERDIAMVYCQMAELRHECNDHFVFRCEILRGGICLALNGSHYRKRARTCYKNAIEMARRLGQHAQIPRLLINLGMLERDDHRFKEAIRYFSRALEIEEFQEIEARVGVLNMLGEIHLHQGEYVKADEALTRAYKLSCIDPIPMRQFCILRRQIEAKLDAGDSVSAQRFTEECIRLADKTATLEFKIEARLLSAMTHGWDNRKNTRAVKLYREANALNESHTPVLCARLFFECAAILTHDPKLRATALGAALLSAQDEELTSKSLKKRYKALRTSVEQELGASYKSLVNRGKKMSAKGIVEFTLFIRKQAPLVDCEIR